MINFIIYESDGTKTLSDICKEYNVEVTSVLNNNGQSVTLSLLESHPEKYGKYMCTKSLLSEYSLSNSKLPVGLEVRVPSLSTGGTSALEGLTYDVAEGTSIDELIAERVKLRTSTYNVDALPSNYTTVGNKTFKDFDCCFWLYRDGVRLLNTYYLPVFPQEFSDSNSAVFSAQSMLGRSVDYQVYNSSSRSVSFTLQFHEELVPDNLDYVHEIVARIESACYPEYSNSVVQPPEIEFQIGSHFRIRGILESCSAAWKAPIIDGKLVNCDLSVCVRETSGPYKMSEIAAMKGYRG